MKREPTLAKSAVRDEDMREQKKKREKWLKGVWRVEQVERKEGRKWREERKVWNKMWYC